MEDQSEFEVILRDRLEEIKMVPARDPAMAKRGQAKFLVHAVSAGNTQRHKSWNSIFRKERFAMNMILSVLVIAGLLFGGGATVKAAQDDLPNEPLYALKLWGEEVGLRWQNTPEAKVDRLMEMAQTRIEEMVQLSDAGQPIPDSVRQRFEQHIQQALQTCTSMDDATLDRTLLRLLDRIQQQDRDLDRIQLRTQSQDALQILTQTRTMLRERLQLVEDGLLNHEMFRYTVRHGASGDQGNDATPPAQNGNGQQNGQPTSVPGGPNLTPGGPNTNPGGGSNPPPGGPNTEPGSTNTNSGGGSTTHGGNNDTSGNGTGVQQNDTGGNGSGGNRP